MRLKVDVYFDGEEDFEEMLQAIPELARFIMTEHLPQTDKNSVDLVFPLGHIEITKEPNPIDPNECECEDDNINSTDSIQS